VRKEVAIAVTIGASVALIVIGAILRFGVTWHPAHVDLQVIGVILMVAGVLGLALSLLFMVIRRNDRRSTQVYEERRYTDPPV
jgi:type II secretory pathway component PulK